MILKTIKINEKKLKFFVVFKQYTKNGKSF